MKNENLLFTRRGQQLLRPQVAELVCITDEPGDWRVTPGRPFLTLRIQKHPWGSTSCRCTTIRRFDLRLSIATFGKSTFRFKAHHAVRRGACSHRRGLQGLHRVVLKGRKTRPTLAPGAKGDKSRDALGSHGR